MSETMQQYYRDQKDRRLDPVLPPDVFVHLRFPETDSRKENQVYSEFFTIQRQLMTWVWCLDFPDDLQMHNLSKNSKSLKLFN